MNSTAKTNKQPPKQVKSISTKTDSSSDEEGYLFAKGPPGNKAKTGTTTVSMAGIDTTMIVDSGCPNNILDESDFTRLQYEGLPINLEDSNLKLYPYGTSTPLRILGKFTSEAKVQQASVTTDFYVVCGEFGALLSLQTAQDLELIHFSDSVRHITNDTDATSGTCDKYPAIFQGIGKLKNVQVSLHIDDSVAPVAQRHRKIPYAIRQSVERKLTELEENDIIEDATGPTPWVSPLVVIPKPKDPKDIRLCIDMRAANEAILRERHDTPTVEELIAEVNGSTVFSKLDLRSGYHQVEITPESRYITTFATHVGLKRYKRLNFGISSAAEIFQNIIRQSLEGLEGVLNVSDDILVHAANKLTHDKRLHALFKRLESVGLTLNRNKCDFGKSHLEYFGMVFGEHGMSPDPKKVEALHQAPSPQSADEIRSLLGMAQYSARFIPNLSTITEPLRELTLKDAPFTWGERTGTSAQKAQGITVKRHSCCIL